MVTVERLHVSILRKRGFEARLPARGAGVLFRLGAEGFELGKRLGGATLPVRA